MFCVFLWEWLWIKMVQILLNLSGFQLWSDYPESLLLRQNNTSKTDPRHRCVTHNLPRNKILSQTHFNIYTIYRIETEIWENIGECIIWKIFHLLTNICFWHTENTSSSVRLLNNIIIFVPLNFYFLVWSGECWNCVDISVTSWIQCNIML